MRIAITGASGLIGTALSQRLQRDGHEAVPVVRRAPGDNEIGWSISENRIDDGAFEGIDGVVHLAGAGIEFIIAEMKGPVKDRLDRYGLHHRFGPERFAPTVGAAVDSVLGHERDDIGNPSDRS